jgi:pimeloyl-ACP methyl ester carboxylesterase
MKRLQPFSHKELNRLQERNTALILHGLLGQGRNWRSFAKNLLSRLSQQQGTNWRVLTVDLRCHGNSAALSGFTPPHTMHACAQDLCSFVQQRLAYVTI